MRVTILQHSDGTPPGSVIEWMTGKGYSPDLRLIHKGAPLPTVADFDWLIVLGGGMNVDETDKHPWLISEKALLREAATKGKTVLGLCLGGQLLAQTLGAAVKPHCHWEVGWHPVHLEIGRPEPGRLDVDNFELVVFQFHQDTFALPPGARRIATNAITDNQGFVFGDHVVGLQFHPEATAEWVRECAEEKPYPSGPHVQTPAETLAGIRHIPSMRRWFFGLLDDLETKTVKNWPTTLRSWGL